LEGLLSKLDSKWKIVFGHHPIRAGGRAEYFQDRGGDQIQDILQKHQVDLYLSGHNYLMEMGAVDQEFTYAILGG
jgi:acid phosphatase